ncbi:hypothetical protein FYK55_07080 [Roseiconus nitratireducens]|uniref:Uncharacterized protein n=1 Tax=Roseiconus nitratireducens TaxID=2605748 RepID=A0A5M6DCV5_9BACT|nr:hypothetical protein [Roseiconus nitratireducens]KAA5545407.1 hypothetical protein FYK55_07080 [Roseiconus nitratireducens]
MVIFLIAFPNAAGGHASRVVIAQMRTGPAAGSIEAERGVRKSLRSSLTEAATPDRIMGVGFFCLRNSLRPNQPRSDFAAARLFFWHVGPCVINTCSDLRGILAPLWRRNSLPGNDLRRQEFFHFLAKNLSGSGRILRIIFYKLLENLLPWKSLESAEKGSASVSQSGQWYLDYACQIIPSMKGVIEMNKKETLLRAATDIIRSVAEIELNIGDLRYLYDSELSDVHDAIKKAGSKQLDDACRAEWTLRNTVFNGWLYRVHQLSDSQVKQLENDNEKYRSWRAAWEKERMQNLK